MLVCISVLPLFITSIELLAITSIAMILVQSLDGFVGLKFRDKFKTWGSLKTAFWAKLD